MLSLFSVVVQVSLVFNVGGLYSFLFALLCDPTFVLQQASVVIANFIVLDNETCFMYNQPSHEMKCESMPIIFYITSVVKDLKNFTSRRFGSRFI